MPKRPLPRATQAEMEILVLLWRDGPLTAREVQERLALRRRTGYTTALKLLQLMYAKELAGRDESERAHRYEAAVRKEDVQGEAVSAMVDRLFSGSVSQLVMRALSSTPTSAAERAEIRRLLDAHRERKREP